MSEIDVVLHARLDEEKLDTFVRTLYDGVEHNDPAPGEPQPGRQFLDDIVEEAQTAIREGHSPDLSWLDRRPEDAGFVVEIALQRGAPVVICSEQEAALVRALLKRHISVSEKAHLADTTKNPEQVWGSLGAARALLERMGDG